jgi:citrate lyase beta subunit
VLHEVFTPSEDEVRWARGVVAAFETRTVRRSGSPTVSSSTCRVPDRARRLLHLADSLSENSPTALP